MSTYFISDLHLDLSRPWVIDAFEAFLAERRHARALYILGDLFEFWIGDDDDSELVARIASMLSAYSGAGPALYIMHGNRDFLIGQSFAERCGAELLEDPCVIELPDDGNGAPVVLSHGDSLCTQDEDYQAFRRIARSPDWQAEMLSQSLETRRQLAEQLRKASKDAGSRKAADIMDVTEAEVVRLMQDKHSPTLIHGHTHRPARHENAAGVRWVLGDWDERAWYLQYGEGAIELHNYPIPPAQ